MTQEIPSYIADFYRGVFPAEKSNTKKYRRTGLLNQPKSIYIAVNQSINHRLINGRQQNADSLFRSHTALEPFWARGTRLTRKSAQHVSRAANNERGVILVAKWLTMDTPPLPPPPLSFPRVTYICPSHTCTKTKLLGLTPPTQLSCLH